jgi:hypothetical protein
VQEINQVMVQPIGEKKGNACFGLFKLIQKVTEIKEHRLITFGEFGQAFGTDWYDAVDIEGYHAPKRISQGRILTCRLESIKLFDLILSSCQIFWNPN